MKGKTFAIWGLSFKPGTDDMREAPSINLINSIVNNGGKVNAYDPKAMDEAQHFYLKDVPNITYFTAKYAALENADAMILLTEWKEFRAPDFGELKKLLKSAVIFDGRNQYDHDKLKSMEFEYYQIGKKS